MKIPPNTEPIAHVSPYRRIDPEHPSRKRIITLEEWVANARRQSLIRPSTATTHGKPALGAEGGRVMRTNDTPWTDGQGYRADR